MITLTPSRQKIINGFLSSNALSLHLMHYFAHLLMPRTNFQIISLHFSSAFQYLYSCIFFWHWPVDQMPLQKRSQKFRSELRRLFHHMKKPWDKFSLKCDFQDLTLESHNLAFDRCRNLLLVCLEMSSHGKLKFSISSRQLYPC